jgi:protein TonB
MIEKKKSGKSLERNRMAFFSAGLILVSSLVLTAFEWKSLTVQTDYSARLDDDDVHMIQEDIITELPEPPKPKEVQPPRPVHNNVAENVIIDNRAPDVETITDIFTDQEIGDIEIGDGDWDGPKEDVIEKEWRFVEQMPEFPGGEEALMRFIQSNVEYPAIAREYGEQGTAYIEFTIGTDGSISKVKALKDLDYGLNEEAIRVIKEMPKWKPGEQRGRKVKVRFTVPIKFKLKNN